MTWSRDTGSLSPYAIIRRGSLRIDRVVATDAGMYTCRAESQAGTSVASASLTLHCKFKDLKTILLNQICKLFSYLSILPFTFILNS